MSQGRTLQRTPEWTPLVYRSAQTEAAELYVPFFQLHGGSQQQSNKSDLMVSGQQPKVKTKTRGATNAITSSDNAEAADQED